MIPATPENIERAKEFVWEKWKERAQEMGRPEPEDLSSACKFASMFAEMVFGGRLRGNWQHQFAELDQQIIDLTAGRSQYADPKYYHHDRRFWRNPEHRESMASCEPRVKRWAQEFLALMEHEEPIMFTYLNEIRKRAGLPLMEMTYEQAIAIFKKHGVDARHMPEDTLKRARRKLDMKYHPDRNPHPDAEATQKDIAQAYGIIQKAGFERAAGRPSGGPQYGFRGAPPGGAYGGGRGQGTPPWQTDPRGMSNIYREDYRDVNFIKKSMWEKSGKSKQKWTIMGYDGSFFRNQVTVFGSPKIFNEMAEAMRVWQSEGGNPYKTYAVFAAKGNKLNELYVLYVDGKFMGDDPYILHSSGVPYNDQQFMRNLPDELERIIIKSTMGDKEDATWAKEQGREGMRKASEYAKMQSGPKKSRSYGKA